MTARIYIDFERFGKKVIEFAAIAVYKRKLLSIFHSFVNHHVSNDKRYNRQAQFSHCIHLDDLQKYGDNKEDRVKYRFVQWLKNFDFERIIIIGHGDDTTKKSLCQYIPQLESIHHLEFRQITLPVWILREHADYHLATAKMKTICRALPCNASMHCVEMNLYHQHRSNLSRIAKYMYGFHCSMYDCFELAFFENTLPLYRCDDEFFNEVVIDSIQPYLKRK